MNRRNKKFCKLLSNVQIGGDCSDSEFYLCFFDSFVFGRASRKNQVFSLEERLHFSPESPGDLENKFCYLD